jgi:asparagine synthase (glutamine-hydrolysing)
VSRLSLVDFRRAFVIFQLELLTHYRSRSESKSLLKSCNPHIMVVLENTVSCSNRKLNLFRKSYKLSIKPPSWHLAWGTLDNITGAAWQDEHLAVFQPNGLDFVGVISPSQRFLSIGEVWLSDRSPLTNLPKYDPDLSDLQAIALAWEHWGTATMEKLVGIFGLAIWDRQEQKLYLGRDCSGGRSLYYTTSGATRWIAPTLRTLNSFHAKEVDPIALRDYLCCSFVPGERTLWAGVREMRPGTWRSFPDEQMHSYWQLQESIADRGSLADCGHQLHQLLIRVVREHLPRPEQPVGCFLSGGLDSSCMTALAAQLHPGSIHSYSIHFGAESPNELEFSGLVARHCGTQHHVLEITFRQMWEELGETMAWLDDPINDPLTVPNLLLGRLASQDVRVVLNGEGGDPCFGGPKNQPMLLNRLYGAVHESDPLAAYLRSFQKCATDLPQLLKPDLWSVVRGAASVFSDDLLAPGNYLNRLMALNIKFKGADQILTKVSNLTQAAGIAGRSPLFDRRIVELSMQIPPEYKLSGVQEKAVLKQAVADLLPREIIDRPKSGMMVPVQLGFKKYWQREAKRLLLDRRAEIAPYLNQSLIKDWLNYENDTWRRYGVKLWLLVSLELWLQVNRR